MCVEQWAWQSSVNVHDHSFYGMKPGTSQKQLMICFLEGRTLRDSTLWLWTKVCPVALFVNQAILGYSHTHHLHIWSAFQPMGDYQVAMTKLPSAGPKSLKCLPSALYGKAFAIPWCKQLENQTAYNMLQRKTLPKEAGIGCLLHRYMPLK